MGDSARQEQCSDGSDGSVFVLLLRRLHLLPSRDAVGFTLSLSSRLFVVCLSFLFNSICFFHLLHVSRGGFCRFASGPSHSLCWTPFIYVLHHVTSFDICPHSSSKFVGVLCRESNSIAVWEVVFAYWRCRKTSPSRLNEMCTSWWKEDLVPSILGANCRLQTCSIAAALVSRCVG